MPWSPDLYTKALEFAAFHHGDQKTPGKKLPYVVHVALVCAELKSALLAEPGLDEDLAVVCALLHDTLEDTKATAAEVEALFGKAVANGVAALSKNAQLPKADQMADSVRRIKGQPKEIWMVKLADRTMNMRPPPSYWTKEKCQRYREEAKFILSELGEASKTLAARLQRRINEYPIDLVVWLVFKAPSTRLSHRLVCRSIQTRRLCHLRHVFEHWRLLAKGA